MSYSHEVIGDPQKICEAFNVYFATIDKKIEKHKIVSIYLLFIL